MRSLTLRQLRAVTAIGRTGRIVLAAKDLGLTPPAVTLQLQQLEAETGFALFDRTVDGLKATDAGRILLEMAADVNGLLALCGDRLEELRGVSAGRVAIGVVSTAKYFAPNLIAGFARRRPGVEVSLNVGNRDEVARRLKEFQIDVAIMGMPPRDLPVETMPIGDHPLVIVAPPSHRLAARRSISKAELSGEAFLMREEGSGTRTSMESYLDDVSPRAGNLRIAMGSNETIKQAVMAGLGIAFISAHTTAAELTEGRLVALDVEGLPVLRHWFGVRRADKTLMPAVHAFCEFLQTEGASFLPVIAT